MGTLLLNGYAPEKSPVIGHLSIFIVFLWANGKKGADRMHLRMLNGMLNMQPVNYVEDTGIGIDKILTAF